MRLEKSNFHIDSSGWEESTIDGRRVKTNPLRDVIETLESEAAGEQHFRWGAAKRETAKAGKRMPTDAEWDVLIAENHPPHLPYETLKLGLVGVWVELPPEWPEKNSKLTIGDVGQMGIYWSDTEAEASGYAWRRGFSNGRTSVTRYSCTKDSYLSVRCLEEAPGLKWRIPYRECEIVLPESGEKPWVPRFSPPARQTRASRRCVGTLRQGKAPAARLPSSSSFSRRSCSCWQASYTR